MSSSVVSLAFVSFVSSVSFEIGVGGGAIKPFARYSGTDNPAVAAAFFMLGSIDPIQ